MTKHSEQQGLVGHAYFVGPFGYRLGASLPRQAASVAPISVLDLSSYPSTILGRVWAVIIASIEEMTSGGAWSHIGEKRGKSFGILPLFADGDPAPSIVFESFVGRIQTSLERVIPSHILRGIEAAVGQDASHGPILTLFTPEGA